MTARTVELKENVLGMIEQVADNSSQKIANTLNVKNRTVWEILKAICCNYTVKRSEVDHFSTIIENILYLIFFNWYCSKNGYRSYLAVVSKICQNLYFLF